MMEEKLDDIFGEHPELKEREIVAHTFSNNGIQTWCNVRDLLPHPQGFIFDSGKTELFSFLDVIKFVLELNSVI